MYLKGSGGSTNPGAAGVFRTKDGRVLALVKRAGFCEEGVEKDS